MKTRSRAALLALTAALALGACTKAPATTTEAGAAGTATSQTEQSSAPDVSEAPQNDTTPATDAPTEAAPQSANAQLKVKVDVKADPDAKAKTVTTLNPKTALGSKTTLLVVDTKDDWLKVSLPTRPNGGTGWIPTKSADVRGNDMQVNVDLAAKKAVVSKAGKPVLETPVAIGTNENPTPKGTFYVTDLVQTNEPGGAYGPFALGLSAHSETLTEFGGGDGQVALHGTNEPNNIGKAVSHGCVRLPNDVITKLAKLAPLGTPVVVA